MTAYSCLEDKVLATAVVSTENLAERRYELREQFLHTLAGGHRCDWVIANQKDNSSLTRRLREYGAFMRGVWMPARDQGELKRALT